MKKRLVRAIALMMVFLFAVASAFFLVPAGHTEAAGNAGKIVILHTNDVHCQVDQLLTDKGLDKAVGYASIAAYKKAVQDEYGKDRVTLVDAGDFVQGGAIGSISKGEDLIRIMDKVGYDLAVPGNHEFDYGFDQFQKLAEMASFPYICCNLTKLSDGQTLFPPYLIKTYGSVKIAFLGITTPESLTKSTPAYFQDKDGNYLYSFAEDGTGQKLYDTVQKNVDAARAEGADYVIAVAHLGANNVTTYWNSLAVVKNTTGIDVLIDGHSHEIYNVSAPNRDGEEIPVVQTGTKSATLGQIVIDSATGKITCREINYLRTQDADTLLYVKSMENGFAAQMQQPVGSSAVTLTTLDTVTGKRRIRSGETNLGDFCADASRIVGNADIGLINGGGIRSDIAAGQVTFEDLLNLYPYTNTAVVAEATGQQILDALEFGSMYYPSESGGFLQVSGLTYTLDATIPSSVVITDKREFVSVNGPYRVQDVRINGVPLDRQRTYKVAGISYMLLNSGDGYTMFGKNVTQVNDSAMLDTDVLMHYIQDHLGGTIGNEYSDPLGQGRITIRQ
ncbi:MAG: bifunctional metallophosphatase/5'-nucleotidase [Lachnospiraceae bacterium]|jgi:2',3'-cyclic-nucleotide 2'-phosphodiesterase (5'-nucleotidase family)|nr:bifunctional metallophosphatase/5'-nucleotidase [Lachnospiraceae bacterium]